MDHSRINVAFTWLPISDGALGEWSVLTRRMCSVSKTLMLVCINWPVCQLGGLLATMLNSRSPRTQPRMFLSGMRTLIPCTHANAS